jgi:putative SOS response-associated peptidase YedK
MQPIHERMPVIMPVDHYRGWLNKSAADDDVFQLLENSAYTDMTTTPISDYVNNPRHNDERCME